jgi:cell wall assembly regulator SMI1
MSVADALKVWDRIDTVLQSKMLPAFESFLPGVSWDELLKAEGILGQQLPDCVRAAYLRHNGQRNRSGDPHCFLEPFSEWLPLEAALEDWRMFVSLASDFTAAMTEAELNESLRLDHCAIRHVSFHAGHIPIGSTYAGSHFFVDLAPGKLGVYGQVFSSAPEDVDLREPCGSSFEGYMLTLVEHLDRGTLIYNKRRGLIEPVTGEPVMSILPTIVV